MFLRKEKSLVISRAGLQEGGPVPQTTVSSVFLLRKLSPTPEHSLRPWKLSRSSKVKRTFPILPTFQAPLPGPFPIPARRKYPMPKKKKTRILKCDSSICTGRGRTLSFVSFFSSHYCRYKGCHQGPSRLLMHYTTSQSPSSWLQQVEARKRKKK